MSLVTVDTSPTSEPATSPFAAATATIQAAAKWIVAALAAVGGVLVSSVPLTGLGKFNSFHEFVYAGIGLLVALAAVGFTIGAAARVLTTEHITLSALAADRLPTTPGGGPEPIEETIRQITRSREELFGDVANDLGDLSSRLAGTNKALRNASTNILYRSTDILSTVGSPVVEVAPGAEVKAASPDKGTEAASLSSFAARFPNAARTLKALRNASTNILYRSTDILSTVGSPIAEIAPGTEVKAASLDNGTEAASLSSFAARLQDAARTVVEFANYDVARRNFSTLTVRLLAAGFIAVVGVADYAYWVSRPEIPEIKVTQPTPVLVSLPREWPRYYLGINCDISRVSAVAIAGTIERPTVVTVPTDQCAALRFQVPSNAVVIPVKDLPSP